MTTTKRIIACILLSTSASCIDAFVPASPIVRPATRLSAADIDDVDERRSRSETIANNGRRRAIQHLSAVVVAASSSSSSSCLLLLAPLRTSASASAADVPSSAASEPYVRSPSPNDKFRFGYSIIPPPTFVPGNKPLKTHLDEINFSSPDGARGYTLGITVDPVRISSIREFGSPGEVAARVVTAELNRDGVFEVTLAKDPKEDDSTEKGGGGGGGYDVEYVSDGKRGKKRFVTRIYVRDGFLYVLTVQSKEDEYDKAREAEVLECVGSFRPL